MSPASAPAQRPTRSRVNTRSRLLAGALEVMAERGIPGASIEDICSRAGFTRGAFYSNFRSKEDLALALYRDRFEQLTERIESVLAGQDAEDDAQDDDEDGDGATLRRLLDVLPRDRQWYLFTSELTLLALRDPRVGRRLVALRAELRSGVARFVRQVVERRGRHLSTDADLVARALIALHEGSLGQHLLEPAALPVDKIESELWPLLLATLQRGAQ